MNEAATATAIFPFIGMNRSTNPINRDHPPNPLRPAIINTPLKNQPPPTSPPDPPDNPRSAPTTRPTTNDGHQPDKRKSGNRRADPGPVPDQPPPHPSAKTPHPPMENTRATTAAEGRSSWHRPTAASPTDSRRTTSAAPRQATTPRRGTGSRAPRSTPASPPAYPQQGNQSKVSRLQNRNGAQPNRSENPRAPGSRCISWRFSRDPSPRMRGSQLQHAHLKRLRPIPAHAGREHNEEVNRRADAGTGDRATPATVEHPGNPGCTTAHRTTTTPRARSTKSIPIHPYPTIKPAAPIKA